MRSLKQRIAIGAFLIVALLSAISGTAYYHWTKEKLEDELERQALVFAQGAAAQASVSGDFLELYHGKLEGYLEGHPGGFLQILNQNGVVLFGPEDTWEVFDYRPDIDNPILTKEASLDGQSKLGLKYTFIAEHEYGHAPPDPYHAVVIVGLDRRPLLKALGDHRIGIFVISLAGALIGAVLMAALAKMSTRSLDEFTRRVDGIDHIAPVEMPPIKGLPSECEGVFNEVNVLLNRIATEMDRERQFTANISHELRTPLTGLRSTIEVGLRHDKGPEQYDRTLRTSLEIVLQAERLIDQLLSLRRAESGQLTLQYEPAELNECLEVVWQNFSSTAEDRHLEVTWRKNAVVPIHLPLDLFMLVLSNLIENAVNYATEGGRLFIESFSKKGSWELIIRNSQSGLTKETLARMFEPFWRLDDSRSATGTHAGLGLAISQSMAKICGLALQPSLVGDELVMRVVGTSEPRTTKAKVFSEE